MKKLYVSEIIGNPIYNANKEKVGKLKDVVAASIDKKSPRIQGIIVSRGPKKRDFFIPEHDIDIITEKDIHLSTAILDLTPFKRRDDEGLLVEEVFDKQVVDIDDRRITRVNDLLIEKERGYLRLSGVDVSFGAILYRIGLKKISKTLKRNVVDWEDVQFIGGNQPLKFKLQYKNLESLHPVDIARIIFKGPGYKRVGKVLTSMKDPVAADVVEELSPNLQKKLIEEMPFEDVIDIVKHMEPDEAADLLITLGSETTHKILLELDENQAQALKTLLNYPEDTAGAFMNTEFLEVPSKYTVADTLNYIKELEELPDFATYIYIVRSETKNQLVGVVSAQELFKAEPRSRISAIMVRHVISAHPFDSIKDILKIMHKYSFGALPIVSKEKHTIGIVTYHDAASVFLPKSWDDPHKNHFY